MKEFVTKRGGRYLFNEDFDNIQDTIAAIASFLKNVEDPFVISGCERDGDYVNGGFVFLDGKIRKLERTDVSGLQPPIYIISHDVEYKRDYKDGENKVVAVDYKARIVDSSEVPAWPVEAIESDEDGVFLAPIFGLWDEFLITDNDKEGSDEADNEGVYNNRTTDNITFMGDGVGRAKQLRICKSGYTNVIDIYIKDDGTLVFELNHPRIGSTKEFISKMEIGSTGLPISFYSSEGLVYQIGTKEGFVKFILLLAYAINGKTIDAAQYLLNGTDIHDLYFSQQEYADTGWKNIIDTSTGEGVDGFFARRIMDIVYIQGTLPSDFLTDEFRGNAYIGNHVSHYKLPDLSLDGDSYLPDELNFCHLHTIAYIGYTRSISGAIGVDHTIGCAVRLNSNGEFCVYQGKENGKAEGLYDNSFPVHNISYDDKPIVYGLRVYDYDNAIRPHVSWTYAVNTGLKATNIRYAFGINAKYNPAPGYIVNGETYSGYLIHEYCFKNKYVNSGTGEKLEKTWRYSLIKMQYRLKTRHVTYKNHWIWRTISYTYDTDWIDAPISYLSDWVDYRYYTSVSEQEWTMRESSGIHFENPGNNQTCDVLLTYYNNELNDTQSNSVTIGNTPDLIDIEVYEGEITSVPNSSKYIFKGLYLIVYEQYYYEAESSYRSYTYSINNGERTDSLTISIVQGSEYVQLGQRDGHTQKLIFTSTALNASSKFTVTVRVTMSYKGMPDQEFTKDETFEIDPAYYTLQNE